MILIEFDPVETMPVVSVKTLAMIGVALTTIPGVSLIVRLLNVVEAEPPIVSAADDAKLKRTVLVAETVRPPVELFIQLPMSVSVPLPRDLLPLPESRMVPYVGVNDRVCVAVDELLYSTMLPSANVTVENPVGKALAAVAELPTLRVEPDVIDRVLPAVPVILNAEAPFAVFKTPPPLIVKFPVRFVVVKLF